MPAIALTQTWLRLDRFTSKACGPLVNPWRLFSFRPRLADHLAHYSRHDFRHDLAAGLTVGVVALPLAIAFGIASGTRPENGLVSAIIAGFLISALGGSRVQIGGPAGAFVALLYAIVDKYGVANLLIATSLAGVLIFAMGAFKLGGLIRFIPVSVVLGFTGGIAFIIGLAQIKDFLGLQVMVMPANFFSQLKILAQSLHTVNFDALAIGALSVALLVLFRTRAVTTTKLERMVALLPGTFLVLVAASLAAWLLELKIETIGSKFGALPQALPSIKIPHFDWETARNLFAPTVAIALLCAIESLLCARIADTMIDDRHDPNQELMAQGIANFIVPFFGGIAATGTIARTVTNVRSGARTPVAGMIHALTLLVILLVAAPLAAHIPLAALAAILLWVAYGMGPWAEFRRLNQFSLFYRTTFLATFIVTVAFDVVTAIEVGLVLSSLFFIFRIADLTRVDEIALTSSQLAEVNGANVRAYRLFGSLFFGSVNKLEHIGHDVKALPDVLILDMHQVINVDTTALEVLDDLRRKMSARQGQLLLVGVNHQPLSLMQRANFTDQLGAENLVTTFEAALARCARPRVQEALAAAGLGT